MMRQSSLLVLLLLLVLLSADKAWSVEDRITKHSIKSDVFGKERDFFVKLPTTYNPDSKNRYPVIYLLDGKQHIQHFFNLTDALSKGGITPEFIFVGIENNQRMLDLTPTALEGRSGTGGADKFLQYIEQELIPHIDKSYQTNRFKILSGHSLGGLFTLHAMQAKPELFNAHFAFSPSLYWDEKTTVQSVKSFLSSRKVHHNYLFMNMGNEGLDDPYENSIGMREGYIELVEFMDQSAPEKFRFSSKHMEHEYHAATVVVGPFDALRSLYQKYPLPTAKIKQGLDAIKKHYEALSNEVGIKINATQGRMFNAGMYHLWATSDLEKGIEILEYNVSLHPTSDRSYDGLAQLYEANKQLEYALKNCDLSLQYSEPESPNYQRYKNRCEEIRKKLETSS